MVGSLDVTSLASPRFGPRKDGPSDVADAQKVGHSSRLVAGTDSTP